MTIIIIIIIDFDIYRNNNIRFVSRLMTKDFESDSESFSILYTFLFTITSFIIIIWTFSTIDNIHLSMISRCNVFFFCYFSMSILFIYFYSIEYLYNFPMWKLLYYWESMNLFFFYSPLAIHSFEMMMILIIFSSLQFLRIWC